LSCGSCADATLHQRPWHSAMAYDLVHVDVVYNFAKYSVVPCMVTARSKTIECFWKNWSCAAEFPHIFWSRRSRDTKRHYDMTLNTLYPPYINAVAAKRKLAGQAPRVLSSESSLWCWWSCDTNRADSLERHVHLDNGCH
jgi:hypothetical protein